MIPDSFKKSVQIPITVRNGEIELFYGGVIPKLQDGTIGDLIVPRYSVEDTKKLEQLTQELEKELLPCNTTLLVNLKPSNIADKSKQYPLKVDSYPIQNDSFFQITLKEPLLLLLRGTKKSELKNCKCSIPSIPDAEAVSLNHAYTLLSEKFETTRRSHTGNVYKKVFFKAKDTVWRPISALRDNAEWQVEHCLIILSQKWWFKIENQQVSWAFLKEESNRSMTMFLLGNDGTVYAEHYFSEKPRALGWIKDNQYDEYDSFKSPQELNQPVPPYKKINGDIVEL